MNALVLRRVGIDLIGVASFEIRLSMMISVVFPLPLVC